MPLPPRPVIDAQHAWHLYRHRSCSLLKTTQQRRPRSQQPKTACQTSSGTASQSQGEPVQGFARSAASSCIAGGCSGQPLGEDLLSATITDTEELTRLKQDHPPADPPRADPPACVDSDYGLGEMLFHMPGRWRSCDRFAAPSRSRHPSREDRPGPLPRCSGPGILASSAGAEAARATSVLRSKTPAGKNHQMCARTVEMSPLCQVEMSYKDGLGSDECEGSAAH